MTDVRSSNGWSSRPTGSAGSQGPGSPGAMLRTRTFDPESFADAARRATLAAKQSLQKRFHVPVLGTLKCVFGGTVGGVPGEAIFGDTKIRIRWEYKSPRVSGTIEKRPVYAAIAAIHDFHQVMKPPRSLGNPLMCAFVFKKLAAARALPGMQKPQYAACPINVLAICASKSLTEPFEVTVAKRRHRGLVTVPIVARITDEKAFVCMPTSEEGRPGKPFLSTSLRIVSTKAGPPKRKKKRVEEDTGAAAGATTIELPQDMAAYDRNPWKCLRDARARASWRAAAVRAEKQGTPLDLETAMSHMVSSPFDWTPMVGPDKTVFVIWTTGEGRKIEHHLSTSSLPYLAKKLAKRA